MTVSELTASTQPTAYVIATSFEGTRAALETAIPFARGAQARLVLLVPQVVPYPLAIDAPASSKGFAVERYRHLLEALKGEARVRVCLCRRENDPVDQLMPSGSTVFVGGSAGTWHASREERLARRLTHRGHHVIFTPIVEGVGTGGGAVPQPDLPLDIRCRT